MSFMNYTSIIQGCLSGTGQNKTTYCDKANQDICTVRLLPRAGADRVQQTTFDNRVNCAQCLFSSASSSAYANDTVAQTNSRRGLDEIVQGCGILGHQLVNKPLYTQWPLPTNPALAFSVSSTSTQTAISPFQTNKPSGAGGVGQAGLAVIVAAVGVHLLVVYP